MGDWPRNDDIYNELHEGEVALLDVDMHVDNESRVARSMDEMTREAHTLARLFHS